MPPTALLAVSGACAGARVPAVSVRCGPVLGLVNFTYLVCYLPVLRFRSGYLLALLLFLLPVPSYFPPFTLDRLYLLLMSCASS